MVDAKTETSPTSPAEKPVRNAPLSYDSMRFLLWSAVHNWIAEHEAGRNDSQLMEIIDDPNESDESKGEAADIRYLRMLRQEINKPNEEAYPQDKRFPLTEIDGEILAFLIRNARNSPTTVFLKQEAKRRELQLPLDNIVPRDLVQKIAFQLPQRKSKIK